MIKKITEIIDKPQRDFIYGFLRHLNLGLCLDVGPAKGDVTKKLCHVGGSMTRVVAFAQNKTLYYIV